MIIDVNKATLDEHLKEGVVLLDFWAPWCGPCKQLGVTLGELSNDHDTKILKVNVDENPELAGDYNVMGIPSMFFYKDGEIVNRLTGNSSKEKILEVLGELK